MAGARGVTIKLRWLLLALLLAVLAGAGLARWASTPATRMETAAPAERQADGSLKLERRPDPAAKPAQHVPRGAKVERIAKVTVQPTRPAAEAGKPCPPVTIDMTLIREPDGGRRVLASSPDGQVVGGLDVPVEPIILPAPAKRWAAGLSIEPVHQTWGAWVDRDIEIPLVNLAARVGVEVNQTRALAYVGSGIEMRINFGVAF